MSSRSPAASASRTMRCRLACDKPGGGRIDRRQRLGHRRARATTRYFGCTISAPKKPWRISPKRRTRVPAASWLHLARVEIQKAHDDDAAVVLDAAHQLALRPVLDRAVADHALDQHGLAVRRARRSGTAGSRLRSAAADAAPDRNRGGCRSWPAPPASPAGPRDDRSGGPRARAPRRRIALRRRALQPSALTPDAGWRRFRPARRAAGWPRRPRRAPDRARGNTSPSLR